MTHTNSSGQDDPLILVEFLINAETKPWEHVCVVGNAPILGEWDSRNALQLNRKSDDGSSCVWVGHIEVPGSVELEYRHFICQYLDAQKDSTNAKELVVVRWETSFLPRTLIPGVEAQDGKCLKRQPDTFGDYGGRVEEDDGWLINQQELRLRMHSEALKFIKQRHQQRVYRVKCTPIDLRFRDAGSVEDDDDSRDAMPLPGLPSFTSTELANLMETDPSFKQQDDYGKIFKNDKSYFVFRTQTVAREFLAFLFDLYLDPADQSPAPLKSSPEQQQQARGANADRRPERVGFCYFLPNNFKETYGNVTLPITSLRHQAIGMISVDFLKIRPIVLDVPRYLMDVSYARHWKKRHTLDVGHRGMGNSYSKFAATRENTLASLQHATKHGADYVEFDVQLSKDKIPVIYHDFHVCLQVLRRAGSSMNLTSVSSLNSNNEPSSDLHELSIKDLRLNQLRLLKLSHGNRLDDNNTPPDTPPQKAFHPTSSEPIVKMDGIVVDVDSHDGMPPPRDVSERQSKFDVSDDMDVIPENQAFPTFEQVLKQLDPMCGCNVEIKYPMLQKDGEWECDNFWERNEYIDRILADVLNYAGARRIVFSSFDPDICTMIKLKQNKYPVLFLCLGTTTRYMPFLDDRSSTSKMGVSFAISSKLLGVNFHSEDLLRDPGVFKLASGAGLVSFVWGDDLDNKDNIKYFKQLGVDGVIYDRINENEMRKKENVFMVERDVKNRLLGTASTNPSPSHSRDGSLDEAHPQASPTTNGECKSHGAQKNLAATRFFV